MIRVLISQNYIEVVLFSPLRPFLLVPTIAGGRMSFTHRHEQSSMVTGRIPAHVPLTDPLEQSFLNYKINSLHAPKKSLPPITSPQQCPPLNSPHSSAQNAAKPPPSTASAAKTPSTVPTPAAQPTPTTPPSAQTSKTSNPGRRSTTSAAFSSHTTKKNHASSGYRTTPKATAHKTSSSTAPRSRNSSLATYPPATWPSTPIATWGGNSSRT